MAFLSLWALISDRGAALWLLALCGLMGAFLVMVVSLS